MSTGYCTGLVEIKTVSFQTDKHLLSNRESTQLCVPQIKTVLLFQSFFACYTHHFVQFT